eukprot:jgi/Ulvmu1/6374/UM003_0002.1
MKILWGFFSLGLLLQGCVRTEASGSGPLIPPLGKGDRGRRTYAGIDPPSNASAVVVVPSLNGSPEMVVISIIPGIKCRFRCARGSVAPHVDQSLVGPFSSPATFHAPASDKPSPKPDVPTLPPAGPAPCCSEASPICACNQCVTQEELALVSCIVPEDDPDSINDCCRIEVPLPFPIDECCPVDTPICSCAGCVTADELAAITCLADTPFNCCDDDGGGGGEDPKDSKGAPKERPIRLPVLPPTVPMIPFDGKDCCPDDISLCCCGACLTPEVCAATSCFALPGDLPDDYQPCCGGPNPRLIPDPEEDPEEDPEDVPELDPDDYLDEIWLPGVPPPVPPIPFDGEDCCPDEISMCCCGSCLTPEVCAATTCAVLPGDLPGDLPDDYRPCCGDNIDGSGEDPETDPEADLEDDPEEDPPIELPGPPPTVPKIPFDGKDCCPDDISLCCCGQCLTPEVCAATSCLALPNDLPDAPADCCGDEGPPPPPPPPPPPAPETCC